MVVVCATSGQIGEQIKSQFIIGLWIRDFFVLVFPISSLRIALSMGKGPGLSAFGYMQVEATMEKTCIQSLLEA